MNKLENIKSKIISNYDDLTNLLHTWRFKDFKIVFTNGCFDILHRGHVEYLAKAAQLGDKLILGLNTDESVKRLKGSARPVVDEYSRAFLMASMHFIDLIVFFDEDTPYNLINIVQPDILVKGSDYKAEKIVGYNIVKQKGGEVKTIELVDGFSTTSLIRKIKKAF